MEQLARTTNPLKEMSLSKFGKWIKKAKEVETIPPKLPSRHYVMWSETKS